MSKDRNIDDAELANISGAGDVEIADAGGGGSEDLSLKRPRDDEGGGGNPANVETDAETSGNVEFGE